MSDVNDSESYSSDEKETTETAEAEERSKIREKLTTMSFEEILKMKEEIGSKLYNKILSGDQNTRKPFKVKRANKNRPQEISSKIKPKVLQKTMSTSKSKKKIVQPRDPRFDALYGTFDKDKFKNDYKFIYELQEKEKAILEKEEKLEKDVERKMKLKSAIQRLKNKSLENKKESEKIQKKMQEKIAIKETLKRGEKPVRKKRSEEKAENLLTQFDELKKNNKLAKYMIKKSKKLNVKEAKKHMGQPF